MKMHKFIQVIVLMVMVLYYSTVFATDITGTWIMNATWTNTVNGQSGSGTATIIIDNQLAASNDFTGKMVSGGNVMGCIKGRVIMPSNAYNNKPYITFERIDYNVPYFESLVAQVQSSTSITNGHFIDTDGNIGAFVLDKQ